MKITDIRIRKIETEGSLRAIASITFDDEFVIHEIKIIEGANGLFVAFPSRKTAEGKFVDVAHPIKTEVRAQIQAEILEGYRQAE